MFYDQDIRGIVYGTKDITQETARALAYTLYFHTNQHEDRKKKSQNTVNHPLSANALPLLIHYNAKCTIMQMFML